MLNFNIFNTIIQKMVECGMLLSNKKASHNLFSFNANECVFQNYNLFRLSLVTLFKKILNL